MAERKAATTQQEARAEVALRRALDEDQLRVVYQPKVWVATGQVAGVEALLRWEHPERGTVLPDEFIPLAERSRLIVPIGAWVLQEACRQAKIWTTSFPDHPPVPVSVDVSARQFDTDFVGTVARALDRVRLAPELLCLEVTETMMMADVDAAVATLEDLKALGVSVSIDDFGTGYSSLAYLRRLPLDELEIDKSFVDGLGTTTSTPPSSRRWSAWHRPGACRRCRGSRDRKLTGLRPSPTSGAGSASTS